jgi:signal transduction histidine kinase
VAAFRDDAGRLWFGTRHGVSRFDPSEAIEPRVVEPRIAFIRMGSTEWPVGEFGETRVAGVALPSRDTTLEIGFFATEPGQPPRLQYRLRDVDEWADARRATTAVYPRLAPGDYEFQVRALAIDGVASTDIASVQFSVPPPFWLSWPFVALVGMIVAGAAYAVHRVRLARLVALERIRTRIATDLHDDIGSTLTRIAMLAEGARRRAGASAESINAPLAAIATASRDLVETVSDIVWAVNPRRDSLRDLTHRMRRFAEETLGECDVALTFSAPPDDLDIALGADLRREIYLIFKECVTNIAKHGHATRASVAFRSDGQRVRLTVADDGRGFDAGLPSEGTGLASMRRRARALGGSLTVESASGRGTRVTLEVDRTISASRPYTSE